MILSYLCGLHGHGYNWAKAILHGLRNEIHFLQSRARSNEGGKPIPVVWAPCFVHILFGLRRNLFAGTPLEEVEGWVGWTHVTNDTDMTLPQLHSKFPKLITSLSDLRQRCQLPEEIPIASPEQAVLTRRPRAEDKQPEEFVPASPEQPVSSKRPHAEDKERGFPSKKMNKNKGQSSGPKIRFTQPSRPNITMGVTTPQPVPTSELTGAIFVEDLNGTSNEDSVAKPPNISIPLPPPPPPLPSPARAPITTIVIGKLGQLPSTERQSAKELSVAIRRDISQVINSRLLPYVQARIQRHIAATDTWKQAYEVELSKDELNTCKYTQEQVLQGQKSARAELLEVKKELRMLQVLHQDVDEGNAASAP
ncbi:hypothetical protein R1flu_021413 [Riccia fluitans]|uniref:Uncharacterized protein n=1 Tax=Riccia fluitans TaxID=41844 RepID=A0ABD1ZQV3_9MARC